MSLSLRGNVNAVCVRRRVHHHAEVVVRTCTVRDEHVRAVTGAVPDINGIGVVEADYCSKVGIGGSVCGSKANDDICPRLARGRVEACSKVGRLRGVREVRPRSCLGHQIYRNRGQC